MITQRINTKFDIWLKFDLFGHPGWIDDSAFKANCKDFEQIQAVTLRGTELGHPDARSQLLEAIC